MNRSTKIATAALASIVGLGAFGAAWAAGDTTNDKSEKAENAAFLSAKLSLTDAAKAAESQTGGKAMSIELEDENGAVAYEVEILMTDGSEQRVAVNAADGKVVKIAQADTDERGEHRERGGHGEEDRGNDEDGGSEH